MTYNKYGVIQAGTYNAYAAIINSLYADTNSGSTTEATADYGYGQAATVANVAIGNSITAAQWTALFSKITAIGTHQGTSVTPIPASVSTGDLIAAYNNYLTTSTLTDVISKLIANRLIVATGQRSVIAGITSGAYSAWTTGLRFEFRVDFGSWNNARYFFNTGGSVTFGGTGSGATGEDIFWTAMLAAAMDPLAATPMQTNWHNTNPVAGAASTKGFYGLTNGSWAKIFERLTAAYGPFPNYSNNYIAVYATLTDAIGTSGKIGFRIELIDNDPTPNAKTASAITYSIGLLQAAGTVPYAGTAASITNLGISSIASSGTTPVPLTLVSSPTTLAGIVNGAGTATTASVSVTAAGGTSPYTYDWTNESGTVTFSNQHQVTAGATSTTFSRSMTSGEIASGNALCTVTDSAGSPQTANVPVVWSMNSNVLNP